jgi:hypothetical protein
VSTKKVGGTNLPPVETRFKPGQSGNPGGKAAGARNRVTAAFLHKLAADFEEHGQQAIERCRLEDPAAYVKVVAGLLPKEVDLGINRLEEMSTDDIIAAVGALRSYLAPGAASEGTDSPPSGTH